MLGPVKARKLSFHLCVLTYRLFALCLQTDSSKFAFVLWSIGQALGLTCT